MNLRNFILATLLVTGCSTGQVEPPSFDGGRAYDFLTDQVAFGPRVPGSEAWRLCREYYYAYFDSCGLAVDSQAFHFYDPYSHADVPLVNIIARYRGDSSDTTAILLAAHWDSRPRTDFHSDSTRVNEPIMGANDGASGVAVLMELARLFRESPPNTNVDLVLLDGEDWGKSGDVDLYLLGSRHLAQSGIRGKYRFGIVVDMVGEIDQQFYRESYAERFSAPVTDMVWAVADTLGITTFIDSIKHSILDDHLPLSAGGVPTTVIIDFDYPQWHTEQDTPDKCSPESLGNVGRVLAEIAYNKSLWPKIK
jgi:Zn-dependent M28 family amino/carboxypeptidase